MNLITQFLTIQSQLRVWHWQTKSYAQHNAFGEAYDSISDLSDSFIEAYQGENGTLVARGQYNLMVDNYDEANLRAKIETWCSWLTGLENLSSNLLNLRDEMLQELRKLLYLLSLK
jgi:hypothetical protein